MLTAQQMDNIVLCNWFGMSDESGMHGKTTCSQQAVMHSDYLMWLVISAPVLHVCAKSDLSYEDVMLIAHVFELWSCILLYPPNPLLSLSISSTLMEMESTVSSGRSTPAMMNGQSSAGSSGTKTVAYPCCWDLCPQCFNSSPDLAEHIRGIHVDGQRGGVSGLELLHTLLPLFCLTGYLAVHSVVCGWSGQRCCFFVFFVM